MLKSVKLSSVLNRLPVIFLTFLNTLFATLVKMVSLPLVLKSQPVIFSSVKLRQRVNKSSALRNAFFAPSLVKKLKTSAIPQSAWLVVPPVRLSVSVSTPVSKVTNLRLVSWCKSKSSLLKCVRFKSVTRWLVVTVTRVWFLASSQLKTCHLWLTVPQSTSCFLQWVCLLVWTSVSSLRSILVWLLVSLVTRLQPHPSTVFQMKLSLRSSLRPVLTITVVFSSLMVSLVNHLMKRLLLVSCTWSNFTTWSKTRFTLVQPVLTLWLPNSHLVVRHKTVVSVSERWRSGPSKLTVHPVSCRKCSPSSLMMFTVVLRPMNLSLRMSQSKVQNSLKVSTFSLRSFKVSVLRLIFLIMAKQETQIA